MSSLMVCFSVLLFFFKQKTAYEMRISDWSSDVCSSDLALHHVQQDARIALADAAYQRQADGCHRGGGQADRDHALHRAGLRAGDRQRLLELAQHETGVMIERETRTEEHTSELQSLMRISYAVFCLKQTKRHSPRHMIQSDMC